MEAYSLREESQRYHRYVEKMRKLQKPARFLYRWRWRLLAAAGAVLALYVCALFLAGSFMGQARCEDFVYGETPVCGLKAPGGEVHYEYAPAQAEAPWQADLPTEPGLYRIRAVSENSLGITRFSREMQASLLPRALTVRVEAGEYVYGDFSQALAEENTRAEGLLPGDQLYDVHYDFQGSQAEGYRAEATQVRVRNAQGRDVTACYRVQTQAGSFAMVPRPVTVRAEDQEKVYDGQNWDAVTAVVSEGTLLEGHRLSVTCQALPAQAGTHAIEPVCRIQDAQGGDVTGCYAVTPEAGTLTVQPIVLQFAPERYEWVYGDEARGGQVRLVGGQILSGHRLEYRVSWPENAGTYGLQVEATVYDQAGEDVFEEGYRVEIPGGKVTVQRRPITLTSGSAWMEYTGKTLTCKKYEITEGSLARGDSIAEVVFTGGQCVPGSSLNTFSVKIIGKGDREVTANYDITYVYGTLTVEESSQDNSEEKKTGATQITFPKLSDTLMAVVKDVEGLESFRIFYFREVSYGDYTGSGWAAPKDYDITGQASPLSYVSAALRGQGVQGVTMEIQRFNGCGVIVPYHMESNRDFARTENDHSFVAESTYSVTCYLLDSLQSPPGLQTPAPQEQAYRKFVYENYLQIPEQTRAALLQWAQDRNIKEDSPTLIEDIQRAVKNGAIYNLEGKEYPAGVDVAVYFLTQAKEGVCQHYASAATLLYRAYGIPARYVLGYTALLAPGKATEIRGYDGHAWTEIYIDGLGWVPIEATGSGLGFGGRDKGPELYVQACSVTKVYDGEKFDDYDLQQYVIVKGELQEGHRLVVRCGPEEKTRTLPGKYLNIFKTCRVVDAQGKDVSGKYDMVRFAGTLTILHRPITIATGSIKQPYDPERKSLTCDDYWIVEGTLAPGDSLSVFCSGVVRKVGKDVNNATVRIRHKGDPESEAQYYTIFWKYGTLELTEPIE